MPPAALAGRARTPAAASRGPSARSGGRRRARAARPGGSRPRRRRRRTAPRELVEAVADRHELRAGRGRRARGSARTASEIAISRRARRAKRAVDVAERAEQVAVVVVPRRDDRDAGRRDGERPVDVGVDEVRVQEVGLLGAHGADHVAREARGDVEAAADAPVRHAERVEPLVEARARRVPGTSSPRKRASIPRSRSAGRSASRWPSEPLTPVSLWRWRTFTEQPPVDGVELVGHPGGREALPDVGGARVAEPRAAARGRGRARRAARASPSTSPISSR